METTHGEPPSGSSRPQPPTLGDDDPWHCRKTGRHASRPARRETSEKREAAAPKREAAAPHKHAAAAPSKHAATAPAKRVSVDKPRPVPAKATVSKAPVSKATSDKASSGKRKASRHSGQRGSLVRGLPSAPILMGIAALAVSAGGAVTAANPALISASGNDVHVNQASAMGGETGVFSTSLLNQREVAVSRDSERQALQDSADKELAPANEDQAAETNAELKSLGRAAEAKAGEIPKNSWHLPTENYRVTARFGQAGGRWTSNHTGLDFAAPSGTPIFAMAAGVVTETGWAGAYGNRTIQTLADGTELYYCHQTSIGVRVGQQVLGGQTIGAVGSTGNSTGPHVHVEVRPGGGDPVDPYQALLVHGVKP